MSTIQRRGVLLDGIGAELVRASSGRRKTLSAWLSDLLDGVGISVTATGSLTERTLADRFAEVFNIEDYGATAASTDNRAAVNLAIAACNAASGGTIYVPEGNFDIDLPSATGLTALGTGTRLKGAGEFVSTLTINTTTTTYLTVLGNVSNLLVEDITIQFNCQNGQTAALLIPGSNVRFRRCRLLSNCTAVADAATNTSILLSFLTTGTQTDISIENCEVSGWGFPILKTNASTSTQRRLRFTNSYWHDNAGSHINLNSPNGVMDDVVISGNTFGDEIGFGAGLGFMLAFASVTNFKVIGNTLKGSTNGEAIHIEENCTDFTVVGNTIEVTSDETGEGDGIFLSSNNIAGSWTAPQRFIISGNIIRRTGSTDGVGIHIVDTSSTTPIQQGVISDNKMVGFSSIYVITPPITLSKGLFIDGRSLRAEGYRTLTGNTLSNNASDATNDIDIAAGVCADSTNTVSMFGLALTKRLDGAWAVGDGEGMLDSGSIANATYHLHRILRMDPGVVDVIASLSHGDSSTITVTIATPGVVSWTGHGLVAGSPIKFTTTGALPTGITAGTQYYVIATDLTADTFKFSASVGGSAVNTSGSQSGTHTCTASPVLPANYSYYRRVGSIIRSGGAILGFVQDGDDFKLKAGPALDVNATNPGTSAVTAALTVPHGIRVKADMRFKAIDTTPAAVTHLYPSDLSQTDAAASGTNTVFTTSDSVALSPNAPVPAPIWTNTSRQIRYRINQSDADISVFGWTFGWTDMRGRLR